MSRLLLLLASKFINIPGSAKLYIDNETPANLYVDENGTYYRDSN
jgi:hypothetical protein